MSEYPFPKKIYQYLAQYKIVGRKYNKSYLMHPQKVSGWNLIGQELTPYDYPNEELVEDFERIIGWKLPETFKKFLIRFGLRDINEDYSAIFKVDNKVELDIVKFFGLIEMIPPFPEEAEWIIFCPLRNYGQFGSFEGLAINPKGEVLVIERVAENAIWKLTDTFEQFLEKIEFRKE